MSAIEKLCAVAEQIANYHPSPDNEGDSCTPIATRLIVALGGDAARKELAGLEKLRKEIAERDDKIVFLEAALNAVRLMEPHKYVVPRPLNDRWPPEPLDDWWEYCPVCKVHIDYAERALGSKPDTTTSEETKEDEDGI